MRRGNALPASLVLAGAVSVQTGAGIANHLFSQLPPASVTTLRLWAGALVLLIVAGRPTARAVADLRRRGRLGRTPRSRPPSASTSAS